ncbi:MAG TPA: hypothetical protein VFV98_12520 [Vicinamibacterales bacterium]|nr:hypothetical protein [Vicinamibacterales bacterium]
MDVMLVTVTIASLLMAATMSAIAWKLMREKRARRAARVEALEALAFGSEPDDAMADRVEERIEEIEVPAPIEIQEEDNWDLALQRGSVASIDEDNIPIRSARGRSVPVEPMFEGAATPGAAARRWMAVAAVALVMAACIATAYALKSPEVVAAVEATRREAATVTGTEPQPLELLSLRHAAGTDGSFTVTGFVQNPLDGEPQNGIVVVVYLFDETGRYFAGGRATLENSVAHPGGESSFSVRVPDAGAVTRYRVGFRHDDGTVVQHVDRRGQSPAGTTADTVTPDSEPAPEPAVNPISARRREG